MNSLIIFIATTFGYLVIAATFLFLLVHKEFFRTTHPWKALVQKIWETLFSFFVGGVAWIAAHVLKDLIHTSRPFIADTTLVPLFQETGYSFPSGHATFFFALAMSVYLYHKRAGTVLFVCAALISIARVLAGVHYPIDILGGAVLGILVVYAVHKVAKRGQNR